MPEKIFAAFMTVGLLTALAMWVPCLEVLRTAIERRTAFAVLVRHYFMSPERLHMAQSERKFKGVE